MSRSLEWIKSLNYSTILRISFFVLFGWNFILPFLLIYSLGEKALIIFGVFLITFLLILIYKKKWILLLGISSVIMSTGIGGALIVYNPNLLIVWVMMTWLTVGIFLIICGIKTQNIVSEKRKILVSRGAIVILFAIIGIITVFW